MAKKIVLIGGSKGGVGKSMVSMATIDYLQEQGESILYMLLGIYKNNKCRLIKTAFQWI